MVVITSFWVAVIFAIIVSLFLLLIIPTIACIFLAQIVLTTLGVLLGLQVSTALSCAVIAVWLLIVAMLRIKKPPCKIYVQTTRRIFK